jgi:hypothetical protein
MMIGGSIVSGLKENKPEKQMLWTRLVRRRAAALANNMP